jgi:ubiquinone/menaquinone biosynthesis C-methylase UbiE
MPAYVRSSIHGLEGGYSTPFAAGTWDAVVKEIFAEYFGDESALRDRLPALVSVRPRTILDVACGTGESTLAWHRRFPRARITAVDVSPYMLAVARPKLRRAAEVRCANAEELPFADGSFDVVTASLLFHELPTDAAKRVLAEMRRVARRDGEIAILEPYRVGGRALKPIPFPEPYLKEYLATDWDEALREAGFVGVSGEPYADGWMRVARAA